MRELWYFSAPWCEPCKAFGPTMNNIIEKGIKVEKVNIDYDATSASKYNIRSVPTVILVENGKEINRFVGVKSGQEVMNFYNG
tara:strand:- start:30 stop:278 length:249 start_codon:yes stop_codon:yes gene_type:complete